MSMPVRDWGTQHKNCKLLLDFPKPSAERPGCYNNVKNVYNYKSLTVIKQLCNSSAVSRWLTKPSCLISVIEPPARLQHVFAHVIKPEYLDSCQIVFPWWWWNGNFITNFRLDIQSELAMCLNSQSPLINYKRHLEISRRDGNYWKNQLRMYYWQRLDSVEWKLITERYWLLLALESYT